MQVDFYQLGSTPLEQVIASIAQKILGEGKRLLVVAEDQGLLGRLDRMLWDQGPTSFLPHALAGGSEDARQPILLASQTDAPNLARNILIADGRWREAALTFDRALLFFDEGGKQAARGTWRLFDQREEVTREFYELENGKWVKRA